MPTVGFEPTSVKTQSILSAPPWTARANWLVNVKSKALCGTRTHNLKIRSLTRYPIAPHGRLFKLAGRSLAYTTPKGITSRFIF